jgi:hypothetical protein
LKFDAFDRAGFHVIFGQVRVEDRSLYVSYLKATQRSQRGRPQLRKRRRKDARARQLARDRRGTERRCRLRIWRQASHRSPAPQAAWTWRSSTPRWALFAMTAIAKPEAWQKMKLDLTNPAVVQQMTFVFSASRASITDVPKTVAEKMLAKNQPLKPTQPPTGTMELRPARHRPRQLCLWNLTRTQPARAKGAVYDAYHCEQRHE